MSEEKTKENIQKKNTVPQNAVAEALRYLRNNPKENPMAALERFLGNWEKGINLNKK